MIRREEEPIARHLPLRSTDGCFEQWVVVEDEVELLGFIKQARSEKLMIRPVPPFCDAMPPEGGLVGVGLRLAGQFEAIDVHSDGLRVGASVPLALLGLRKGYAAFAGAGGTLADAVEDGWVLPAIVSMRRFKGRGYEESADPDPKALLVSAVIKPNPKLTPILAGTAFKEPKRRGMHLRELLRRVGVGELRLAGAALAEDDPAVLVNRGDATPRQLRLLLSAVKERVHVATGLDLEERMMAPGRGGRL